MRYGTDAKRRYLALCRRYNEAIKRVGKGGNAEFVSLSIALHAAKATVPQSWGRPCFIRGIG